MNNTKEKIEFNLVHVGSDVWEVYFEGKKLMTGSGASCKNLLEAFAEVSRRSSRLICVKNFTAPSGGNTVSRICAARREARAWARRATSWRKQGVNRLTPWTWGAFAHVKRENKNRERASVFS